MVVKEQPDMDVKTLSEIFPEADFILLEGFKYSNYPKFEIVRKGNSENYVCDPKTLLGLVTDMELSVEGVPVMGLEAVEMAAEILEKALKYKG